MKIVYVNDPILRQPTALVTRDQLDYVKSLVPEMTKLMLAEEGAGLAANQVGISMRFYIVKDGEDVKLVINPEIVSIGEMLPFKEGCLSIPGASADTKRAQELKLRYLDEHFLEKEQEYKGFDAAAVQHEIDHLDGKLYVDQLGPLKRSMVLDKHRKYLKMKGRQK